MATNPVAPEVVIGAPEAASRFGLSVAGLTRLIRHYRYEFTELVPGGKPGDRGRNRWGLTETQVRAILRGQARQFEAPRPEPEPGGEKASAFSPDGKSRL